MTPYGKIVKILLRTFLLPHRLTLFSTNLVKFARSGIGEIMRYLPERKKIRLPLKLSLDVQLTGVSRIFAWEADMIRRPMGTLI